MRQRQNRKKPQEEVGYIRFSKVNSRKAETDIGRVRDRDKSKNTRKKCAVCLSKANSRKTETDIERV